MDKTRLIKWPLTWLCSLLKMEIYNVRCVILHIQVFLLLISHIKFFKKVIGNGENEAYKMAPDLALLTFKTGNI